MLLQQLGQDIALDLVDKLSVLSPSERIQKISQVMVSLGYETLIESDDKDGSDIPRIAAYNCVFYDVAKENSEVCELDLTLLRTLSGFDIEHQECMVKGGKGTVRRNLLETGRVAL